MHRWLLTLALLLAGAGLVSANYVLIIANLGESKEASETAGGPGGLPPVGAPAKGPMPMGAGAFVPKGPPGLAGGAMPKGPPGMTGVLNAEDPEAVPLHVVAVIELTQMPNTYSMTRFDKQGMAALFRHKWGESWLVGHTRLSTASIVKIGQRPLPSASRRFDEKYERARSAARTSGSGGDQLVEVADWALGHGLVGGKEDKVALVLDKLVEADPKHPAAVAYAKLKADLARPLPAGDTSLGVRSKLLEGFRTAESPHYVLVHDLSGGEPPQVRSRLDRLETTFKNFYYWFALRGIQLPLPRERLVAVLTGNEKEYDRLYDILTAGQAIAEVGAASAEPAGGLPVRALHPVAHGDGFLGRHANVVVMSAKRLDAAYDALEKHSDPYWKKGFNRQQLVKQNPVKVRGALPQGVTEEEVVDASTIALLLKALEEDAEATGATHAGTRQLVYAAGLLPRNLGTPEWLEFGLASFFETSPGSPWPTTGSANFEYMAPFRAMQRARRLEPTPADTLRTVVTDGYFRRLAGAADKPAALRKARATSWALTYFLAQKKLDGLQRYFKELARMPRDMELTDDMLLGCFARAFDCVDAAKKVDPRKLAALAGQWIHYIETSPVEPELEAVQQLVQTKLKEAGDPAFNTPPGGPMSPGAVNPMVPGANPAVPPPGGAARPR